MKKIMVLAGTYWQIPLIKKLKKMGNWVINVNPYPNSPAFKYADQYVLLDILDKEKCLACAQENQVDAIMSEQCDIANPTVAYVSDRLGLKSIGSEQAELYTNKVRMREFCQKNDFPYPDFKKCSTLEEAKKFFGDVGKEIIIKPLDSNSSRGVYLIRSVEDLEKNFENAKVYSKIENAVLCERYIHGTEFTVDGIMTDSGHISLAVSEKRHYAYNMNIASTLFFSNVSTEYDYTLLKKMNDELVNKTCLPFGLTHAEYKYENGKFILIEIGARGGGNLISSHIVPLMSGVDNYDFLIKKTLGEHVKVSYKLTDEMKERCAVLKFFDTPNAGGCVKDVKGIQILEKNPNIITYQFNFKRGDVIKKPENDSARIGFYIAYERQKKELEELMQLIDEKVVIEYENER